MFISTKKLREAINRLNQVNVGKSTLPKEQVRLQYSSSGPAAFDVRSLLGSTNGKPWKTYEPTQEAAPPKFIFCSKNFNSPYIDPTTIAVITAILREKHEFYLLTKHDELIAISSINDFCSKLEQMQVSTQISVEELLGQQEKTKDGYIVLDNKNWKILLSNLSLPYEQLIQETDTELDLTKIIPDVDEIKDIAKGCDCSKIKSLKLRKPSKEELELIIKKFPSVEKITIFDLKDNVLPDCLLKLKYLEIRNSKDLTELDLTEHKQLNSIYINTCRNLQKIHGLFELTQLELLKIYNCPNLTINDIGKLGNIKVLGVQIANCKTKKRSMILPENLEELNMVGYEQSFYDAAAKLLKLNHVILGHFGNYGDIKIHGLKELESLQAITCRACAGNMIMEDIDAQELIICEISSRKIVLKNLKAKRVQISASTFAKLVIDKCDIETIELINCRKFNGFENKTSKTKEILVNGCEDFTKLGTSKWEGLEKLHIKLCNKFVSLPKKLSDLTELNISNCESLKVLGTKKIFSKFLTFFPKLKPESFEIENCSNFREVKVKQFGNNSPKAVSEQPEPGSNRDDGLGFGQQVQIEEKVSSTKVDGVINDTQDGIQVIENYGDEILAIKDREKLETLIIKNSLCTEIVIENLPKLVNIEIKNCRRLKQIRHKDTQPLVLNLKNCPDLKSADLNKFSNMRILSIDNCGFEELDFSSSSNLESLTIQICNAKNITVKEQENLKRLSIKHCKSQLAILGNLNLKSLDVNLPPDPNAKLVNLSEFTDTIKSCVIKGAAKDFKITNYIKQGKEIPVLEITTAKGNGHGNKRRGAGSIFSGFFKLIDKLDNSSSSGYYLESPVFAPWMRLALLGLLIILIICLVVIVVVAIVAICVAICNAGTVGLVLGIIGISLASISAVPVGLACFGVIGFGIYKLCNFVFSRIKSLIQSTSNNPSPSITNNVASAPVSLPGLKGVFSAPSLGVALVGSYFARPLLGKVSGSRHIGIFTNGKRITTAQYRVDLHNKIVKTGNKININTDTGKLIEIKNPEVLDYKRRTINNYRQRTRKGESGYAKLSITLRPGERQPLPTHQAQLKDDLQGIAASNKNIKIFWSQNLQQFYVQLALEVKTKQEIELAYLFKTHNNTYENLARTHSKVIVSENNLLDDGLRKKITDALATNNKLNTLVKKDGSLADKIETVIKFFQDFCYSVSPLNLGNDVDYLLKIIKGESGVCRHSSWACTILLHFLNIPAVYVESPTHAYVNIPYSDENGGKVYRRVEATGHSMNKKVTKEEYFSLAETIDETKAQKILKKVGDYEITFKNSFFKQPQLIFKEIKKIQNDGLISDNTIGFSNGIQICTSNNMPKALKKMIKSVWKSKLDISIGKSSGFKDKLFEVIYTYIYSKKLEKEFPTDLGSKLAACFDLKDSNTKLYKQCILMIMLKYYGIAAKFIIENDTPFVYVLTKNKDSNNEWREASKVFSENNLKNLSGNNPGEAANLDLVKHKEQYRQIFNALVCDTKVNSAAELLDYSARFNCLVKLEYGQSAYKVNAQIVKHLKKEKADVCEAHLYIDTKEDFADFFAAYKLTETGFEEYGWKSSPLGKLIQTNGLIIINFDNLKPEQIAWCKSILDENRTIAGKKVSSELKIIVLAKNNTTISSAAVSRCKPIALSDSFFSKTQVRMEHKEEKTPIEVDLFGSRFFWKDILLGRISINGSRFKIGESPLLDAQKSGVKLIIYNPPLRCREFNTFIHRLKQEGKLYYQHHFYKKFDIVVEHRYLKTHLNNVKFLVTEPAFEKRKFYLNLATFHSAIKLLKIDKEQAGAMIDGWLDKFEGGDVFYITSNIPKSFWCYLLSHIEKNYPNKAFYFMLAPGCSIEDVEMPNMERQCYTQESLNLTADKHHVFSSNDSDFLAEELKNKLGRKTKIINVTKNMTFQDLIASISARKTEDRIKFERTEQEFLALLRNNNIILEGEISYTLYQQLLSLFSSKPHLWLNGEREEFKYKTYLVLPHLYAEKLKPISCCQISYQIDHYTHIAQTSEDKKNLENLKTFFKHAEKLIHIGPCMPKKIRITKALLTRMLNSLRNNKYASKQNPIKNLFHYNYDPASTEYAYLNTLAKVMFYNKPQSGEELEYVQIDKLKEIQKKYAIDKDDAKTARTHVWHILNCCSAALLRKFFTDFSKDLIFDIQFPRIADNVWEEVWQYILPCFSEDTNNKQITYRKRKDAQTKIQKRETNLLELVKGEEKIIFIKGEPGSGKTYTALQHLSKHKDINFYETTDEIQKWLEDRQSDKIKVLFLDEANRKESGSWDYLKRLHSIYHYPTGRYYKLSDKHKIVATGNLESDPKCSYHNFLQDYGYTIFYKPPGDDYLRKTYLPQMLGSYCSHGAESIIDNILFICLEIKKANKFLTTSMRELNALTALFISLREDSSNCESNDLLYKAAQQQLAFSIYEPNQRKEFLAKIAERLGVKPIDATGKSYKLGKQIILPSRQPEVDILENMLIMREKMLSGGSKVPFKKVKKGILISGASGLGKSSLCQAVLEKLGFGNDAENTQQKYYMVTVGSKDAKDILHKAFHEGSVVVLDEINLKQGKDIPKEQTIQYLLLQLLTGKDLAGQQARKSGFMVFASKNPGNFDGRDEVMQALLNRMVMVYKDNFSDQELIEIAKYNKIKNPEDYVKAYKEVQRKQGQHVNCRTFFGGLQRISDPRKDKICAERLVK